MKPLLCLTLLLSLLSAAAARPVAIGGVPTSPVIETKLLPSGREGLPIWFLPQLGLQTRNNPQDVWLGYGLRTLRYTAQGGWQATGFSVPAPLPAPERYGAGGSLHVGLEVLRALGVPLGGSAQRLDVRVLRPGVDAPEPPVPQVAYQAAPASPPVPKSTPQTTTQTAPKAATVKAAVKTNPAKSQCRAGQHCTRSVRSGRRPERRPRLRWPSRPGISRLRRWRSAARPNPVRRSPVQPRSAGCRRLHPR